MITMIMNHDHRPDHPQLFSHQFCQQARNKVTMNEDFNGNCAILIASRIEGINPAALGRQWHHSSNNSSSCNIFEHHALVSHCEHDEYITFTLNPTNN